MITLNPVDCGVVQFFQWKSHLKFNSVALVGEINQRGLFKHKALKKIARNISCFTKKNKFEESHAESFDLIISVRPCYGGKRGILSYDMADDLITLAQKNNKKYFIIPCGCGHSSLGKDILSKIKRFDIPNFFSFKDSGDGWIWHALHNVG